MGTEVIFQQWITIRALADKNGRLQVKEWFDSLELRDRKRALAGMVNFDATERAGIKLTGRVEPVHGRHRTMLELKLTRGGATGPQLRILGDLRGRTFHAALGFHKKTQRIPQALIARAEATLDLRLPYESNKNEEQP
jgi:hypothetical protein